MKSRTIREVTIGDCRLICGDCLKVLPTIEAGSVDAVVTDPPYGIGWLGHNWDKKSPDIEAWSECLRVMSSSRYMLAFCGTRTSHRIVSAIEDAGFRIVDMFAWLYGQGMPKHKGALKPAMELAVFAASPGDRAATLNANDNRIGVGRYPCNVAHDGTQVVVRNFPHPSPAGFKRNGSLSKHVTATSVFGTSNPLSSLHRFGDSGSAARFFYCAKNNARHVPRDERHPTQKPVSLLTHLVCLVSSGVDVVLDCYCGSGTTGVACVKLGRKFIGIEISETYFNVACKRIEQAYADTALLDGTTEKVERQIELFD